MNRPEEFYPEGTVDEMSTWFRSLPDPVRPAPDFPPTEEETPEQKAAREHFFSRP